MKHLLLALSLLVVLCAPVVVFSNHVAAVDIFEHTCSEGGKTDGASVCKDVQDQQQSDNNPIIHIIKVAINVISFIVGAAAIIGLIVGGIRLTISNGDANAAASARSGIIYSLIGVAVVALAQGIVVFVLNRV